MSLKGGALKREQYLSSAMADIMSNLYLAYSVQWYHEQTNTSNSFNDYCIKRLMNSNQELINKVVDNLDFESKLLCLHLKAKPISESFKETALLYLLNKYLSSDDMVYSSQ